MSRNLPIILAGQRGSGCSEVAQIMRSKIDDTIEVVNTDGIIRSTVARMGMSFPEFYENTSEGSKDKAIQNTIRMKTRPDTIIEGKSAFKALDEYSHRILLKASNKKRARHLSKVWSIPFNEALEMVKRSDKERKEIVKERYNYDWLDSSMYDLVIDTTDISYEQVAETILGFIQSRKDIAVNLQN
jgi:cytidylate kinase